MIRLLLGISILILTQSIVGGCVSPAPSTLIVDESTTVVTSDHNPTTYFKQLGALTAQMPEPLSVEWRREDADATEKRIVYPPIEGTGSSDPIRINLLITNLPGGGVRCRLHYLGDNPAVAAKLRELAASPR